MNESSCTCKYEIARLEQLIRERDRQYSCRFKYIERTFNAAFVALKEQIASAFLSSEKAIVKAEGAQKEYNERSNEFRGQLADQAGSFMPRVESEKVIVGVNNRIERMQVQYDKENEEIKALIQNLRETREEGRGKDTAHKESVA